MDLINVIKKQWDRTAAIVLTLAGLIALVAGYLGVADSQILAEQTRYIVSGGMVGLFLLGVGATLWISADLRDEWRKLDRIEQALAGGVLKWSENGASDTAPARRAPASANSTGTSPTLAHATSSREHA